MTKRMSMVVLTMVLAVAALLVAAKHPTGPNAVSYDKPIEMWLSLGMMIVLFFPPLILSIFNNLAVKIISAIYQGFIALTFFGMIPIGFLVSDGSPWISMIGIIGTIVSICSMIVTILVDKKRKMVLG